MRRRFVTEKKRGGGSENVGARTLTTREKEQDPEAVRQPTLEEWRAARGHMVAMHADANLFMEETLREIEEDKEAGREQDPAEIDKDLRKRRYARIIRDYPPPVCLFPGVAAKYRRYLEEEE